MTANDEAETRLASVVDRVSGCAERNGRAPREVTLVAVSKTFAADAIEPVIRAGQRHFGENRVQEAVGKWPDLRGTCPDLVLHLIGPLQSNKTGQAVALFDVIHTIDRPKIAHAIAVEAERQNRSPQVFIQVNTGAEPQKAGVSAPELPALVHLVRDQLGLNLQGLMCIPPVDDEPALHFALLAKLADESDLHGLSMGMSGDFETAIEFGATHIRVGSAIFGERTKPPAI